MLATTVTCTCPGYVGDYPVPGQPGWQYMLGATVNPDCPVHGPQAAGKQFIEVTTAGDDGRRFLELPAED